MCRLSPDTRCHQKAAHTACVGSAPFGKTPENTKELPRRSAFAMRPLASAKRANFAVFAFVYFANDPLLHARAGTHSYARCSRFLGRCEGHIRETAALLGGCCAGVGAATHIDFGGVIRRAVVPIGETPVLHSILHKEPLFLRDPDVRIQFVFVPAGLHVGPHVFKNSGSFVVVAMARSGKTSSHPMITSKNRRNWPPRTIQIPAFSGPHIFIVVAASRTLGPEWPLFQRATSANLKLPQSGSDNLHKVTFVCHPRNVIRLQRDPPCLGHGAVTGLTVCEGATIGPADEGVRIDCIGGVVGF